MNKATNLWTRRQEAYLRLSPAGRGQPLTLAMFALSVGPAAAGQTDTPLAMTYGGEDYDVAYAIQQTNNLDYIVAAQVSSFGSGQRDAWVSKLNGGRSKAWQKIYGGTSQDSGS